MNHTTNKKFDTYKEDVDIIAFYISEIDTCIMFDILEVGDKTSITIRESIPKNNQSKGIFFIKDHTFNNYFKSAQLETTDVEAGEFDENPEMDNDELNQ